MPMQLNHLTKTFLQVFVFFYLMLLLTVSGYAATLVGWSVLGKNTYTAGPFSQHQPPTGWAPPSAQMIGGFSAGEKNSTGGYVFLTDTGFGPKASSLSSLLGMYALDIEFNDLKGQHKHVNVSKLIRFNDADNKLSFNKQADFKFYGDINSNQAVDPMIKKNRLLTGGDIDPESFRIDYKGNLWVGEEFGPFLIKFDTTGKVLRQEIAIPGAVSPDNPLLQIGQQPTTVTSAGLEGMAINPQGNKLFPMLEKTVIGDPEKSLRMYVFDVDTEQFELGHYLYQLDGNATEIRELVAVNDHEFLTLEQNEHWGSPEGQVKKVYLISIDQVQKNAFVKKTELVDLMHLFDPADLNADLSTEFAFPKLTIETIIVLDKDTLLIANDNNFGERSEFIKVRLDQPLSLAKFRSPLLETERWSKRDKNYYAWQGFHSKTLEWINVGMTLLLFLLTTYIAIRKKWLNQSGVAQWALVSVLVLLFFIYNHLSLYFYATQTFRDLFADVGLYQNRRPLQQSMILTIAIMSVLLIPVTLVLYKNKQTKYTMMVFSMILGLKGLQFVSYHRIDRIMDYPIGIGRVFDWLECLMIILLFIAIVYEARIRFFMPFKHK
jgi:hypothetical protein